MSLFADDGCVIPNIQTRPYSVWLAADCEHVKVRSAVITVSAQSPEDARHYVATYLRIPQTHIGSVTEAGPEPAQMKYKSIPLPGDYAEVYPQGTTASQCQDCGEIRVHVPGDLTDEWKHHADTCG